MDNDINSDFTLKIGLLNIVNTKKKYAMNKELNGGYGTADDYGNSITSKILKLIKRKNIKIPILTLAYLQAILKNKGCLVKYYEKRLPDKNEQLDILLIYGSIVDYKNENEICQKLKTLLKNTKIGFIGPFPTTKPELFETGDFVVVGEAEEFFQNQFKSIEELKNKVIVKNKIDMNFLPTPDFTDFPIKEYSYFPAISEKPFITLQTSRGCPYSCSYYCPYGEIQGKIIRQRSAKKVIEDIIQLKNKYNIKALQFRDPTFGMSEIFINDLCSGLKDLNIKVKWGMETRLDLLNEDKIKKMYEVGLRNINIGIETTEKSIAKLNKRKLIGQKHQERIINICKKLGVKISAFYIFGYEGDNLKTINNILDYAKMINTPLARFSISTPYPGTMFFNYLKKKNRILTEDYENYTQFNLVYKHNTLIPVQAKKLLEKAYSKYYFRLSYILEMIKWKLKEYW